MAGTIRIDMSPPEKPVSSKGAGRGGCRRDDSRWLLPSRQVHNLSYALRAVSLIVIVVDVRAYRTSTALSRSRVTNLPRRSPVPVHWFPSGARPGPANSLCFRPQSERCPAGRSE